MTEEINTQLLFNTDKLSFFVKNIGLSRYHKINYMMLAVTILISILTNMKKLFEKEYGHCCVSRFSSLDKEVWKKELSAQDLTLIDKHTKNLYLHLKSIS